VAKEKILVVDDEASIRKFLHLTLESQGYRVLEAASGSEAISLTAAEKPDVVMLDLGLPDMDGTEVTRLLREWTRIPIVVLSVRGSEVDKVAALDAGADDYLTKPFGTGELLARLRAAVRRSLKSADNPVFISGPLSVDLGRRLVTLEGHEVSLTPNEFDLLKAMVANAGKVLTHRQLLREVWGPEYGDELHMLHVNVSNLRRKIEPDPSRPQLLITEPGVGYRLRI
jgi:two-component system, OmpR family, KDP operon response regulator KdpE